MEKHKLNVLVVEDDAIDYKAVERALSRFHEPAFALHRAETMEKGKRMLEGQDYDAVILDLGLPNVGGLDSLIHFHANAPETPIVVLTGSGDIDTASEAVGMGAEDFLLKSDLYPERLEEKLRLAIRRNGAKLGLLRSATVMQQAVEMIEEGTAAERAALSEPKDLPVTMAVGCDMVLLDSGEPLASRVRFVAKASGGFIEEGAVALARRTGRLAELSLDCARKAIGWGDGLPLMSVHMDLEVDALEAAFVPALLEAVPNMADRQRLCLFLAANADEALFEKAERHVRTLRQAGFSFGLRDLGAGGSHMECLFALEPAWLRLSSRLSSGVAELKAKRRSLERWLKVLAPIGVPVVADQTSTNDLHVLRELGLIGAVVGRYSKGPAY